MTITTRRPCRYGITLGVLFVTASLSACGGSDGSTPATNGESGAWSEYEELCAEISSLEVTDDEDYTNQEVSTLYTGVIERMESVTAPVEVADWHNNYVDTLKAIKALVDAEDQDAIVDLFSVFLNSEVLSGFERSGVELNDMPASARQRLAEAGCLGVDAVDTSQPDSTATPESEETLPDSAVSDESAVLDELAALESCQPRSSVEPVLIALYNSTDGPNWSDNTNWLTDAPLGDWAGVDLVLDCIFSLNLSFNELNGEIPPELGGLQDLKLLFLSGNELSGEIPAELGDLHNLTALNLDFNQLTGDIPAELGNLRNLEGLSLSDNQLSGQIPFEVGGLQDLEGLFLGGNQLTGEIPAELENLHKLTYLALNFNELSGEIPVELGNLINLEGLLLGDNQLSGAIPAELGNLLSLSQVSLSFNELSGEIPAELGNLTNIEFLDLHGNEFSGCASSLGEICDQLGLPAAEPQ